MIDTASLSANELVSKLKSGDISSVDLCNAYIKRIEKFDKDVQAWAFLDKKILLEKAEQNGLSLDYDVVEFIARHIKENVRDLEGTIIRILAKSSLMNIEIDHDLVRQVVQERTGGRLNNDISMEDIIKQVSISSSVPEKEIVGSSRKMEISKARQISMYLCREIMGCLLYTSDAADE